MFLEIEIFQVPFQSRRVVLTGEQETHCWIGTTCRIVQDGVNLTKQLFQSKLRIDQYCDIWSHLRLGELVSQVARILGKCFPTNSWIKVTSIILWFGFDNSILFSPECHLLECHLALCKIGSDINCITSSTAQMANTEQGELEGGINHFYKWYDCRPGRGLVIF